MERWVYSLGILYPNVPKEYSRNVIVILQTNIPNILREYSKNVDRILQRNILNVLIYFNTRQNSYED